MCEQEAEPGECYCSPGCQGIRLGGRSGGLAEPANRGDDIARDGMASDNRPPPRLREACLHQEADAPVHGIKGWNIDPGEPVPVVFRRFARFAVIRLDSAMS